VLQSTIKATIKAMSKAAESIYLDEKRPKKEKAEASIYLDESRPKQNGKCSVKIRITFLRKRKYFSTGIELEPEEFQKVMHAERRTSEQKETLRKIKVRLDKAENVLSNLPVFTFSSFEESYLEQRNTRSSVSFAFDKYIQQLRNEDRIGTAVSYECARNSIAQFNANLTFAEVTPELLKKYERTMLQQGKSISTIGIYLRSFRAIYNDQNIDKSLYPFGEQKNKYSIPTGRNVKKALTIEEIAKIYNYAAPSGSTKEMAKDYWLFLYLCNGMNVKDFCLLKWSNIDGQMLNYNRAKTQRSRKESKLISVALKPETMDIIKKWGQPSISKDAYIFPHLKPKMGAEGERAIYQQLTKTINKYMKRISSELNLDKEVTTYFARHSFATVLKRSGAKIEMISELLGHSSVDITENYLDSFEREQIQKETDVLTAGFRIAN
jgi:integrase/recombinase XerD